MITKLKKYFKADHIILIENYLSEWHGDIHHKERYENTECIAKQNEILKGYYKFFRDHYEGIQIIDLVVIGYILQMIDMNMDVIRGT